MTTIYDDCCKEELLQIVSEMQKDLNDSKKENKELQRIINGVLEQLAEKQNNLSATNKAWSDAIEKNGYVN